MYIVRIKDMQGEILELEARNKPEMYGYHGCHYKFIRHDGAEVMFSPRTCQLVTVEEKK